MNSFNVLNICWFIWSLSIFFSHYFSSCYNGTLKNVYETSNLSNNAFFKHFVFENNLIFNMVRLTFLASESIEVIQKILHLKGISFHQLLIPTKRYLWKNFSPYFSEDPYGPSHFIEKCPTSAVFEGCFCKLPCMRELPQERKFFNWVDLYVNNKELNNKKIPIISHCFTKIVS